MAKTMGKVVFREEASVFSQLDTNQIVSKLVPKIGEAHSRLLNVSVRRGERNVEDDGLQKGDRPCAQHLEKGFV